MPPKESATESTAPSKGAARRDGYGRYGYGYPYPEGVREPSLNDLFALLWRRKGLIVGTVALTTLAAAVLVMRLTPLYTAEARVMIAPRTANVVDIENVLEGLAQDPTTVRTELEVLRSRSLAEKVVGALGLIDNAEFNPHLRPPSLRSPLQWLESFAGTSTALGDPERRMLADTVDAVLGALTVSVVEISRVIAVGATSEDPELAAAIANTLAETYLNEQIREKSDATGQAADWLDERVATIRNQVEEANRAVEDFRARQGLTQASDTTLVEQQISEVNTQLIAARAQTVEADARLRQVRALMETPEGVYDSSDVQGSPLIQNLRLEETRLAGEVAQMTSEYGPRHPKMINVQAELEHIRGKIALEVDRIVRSLENSLEVAQTRERSLDEGLENLKAEASRLTDAQARLRVLEREAQANQSLFDVFLARWKETGQQSDLQRADGRIISRAVVPDTPSWPNRPATMAVAGVFSVLLAFLLVYLAEQLFDRGFQSVGQVEEMLGLGVLGTIPRLKEEEEERNALVLDKPTSGLAEAFRMLHAGLLLTDTEGRSGECVLITSAVANEGKTFTALSLARLLASGGHNVLLVDADLRNGQVGVRLDLSDGPGLAELLAGDRQSVEDVVQRDERSGLHVLTAGSSKLPTSDLLRPRNVSALLVALRSAYELVILDSPPVLLVADARTLARLADRTVFVVRAEDTPRKVAAAAVKALNEAEAGVSGTVLSMTSARRGHRYYPYGYGYGYFRRRGKRRPYYYADA